MPPPRRYYLGRPGCLGRGLGCALYLGLALALAALVALAL